MCCNGLAIFSSWTRRCTAHGGLNLDVAEDVDGVLFRERMVVNIVLKLALLAGHSDF